MSEWSCGHRAEAMCAECYRALAAKAHELAEENDRLREELERHAFRRGNHDRKDE